MNSAQTELRERVMISKRRAQGELGDPNSQKAAYGIPLDLRGTNTTYVIPKNLASTTT